MMRTAAGAQHMNIEAQCCGGPNHRTKREHHPPLESIPWVTRIRGQYQEKGQLEKKMRSVWIARRRTAK
jgi:hypothetical protein